MTEERMRHRKARRDVTKYLTGRLGSGQSTDLTDLPPEVRPLNSELMNRYFTRRQEGEQFPDLASLPPEVRPLNAEVMDKYLARQSSKHPPYSEGPWSISISEGDGTQRVVEDSIGYREALSLGKIWARALGPNAVVLHNEETLETKHL